MPTWASWRFSSATSWLDAYACFTEGFDTHDLQDVKALLAELPETSGG